MAGTGKSVFLSHCYKRIKEGYPDWWAIKINLADHSEALTNQFVSPGDKFDASVDFLTNLSEVIGKNQSPFVCSLLKYRLKTGDRIVLMLDGFDEIDEQCRQSAIELIKTVSTDTKSIRIFVTTRPRTADKIQFELSQLAYTLENFNKKDQIDCITKFWKGEMPKLQDEEEKENQSTKLRNFAETLMEKAKPSLKDSEGDSRGVSNSGGKNVRDYGVKPYSPIYGITLKRPKYEDSVSCQTLGDFIGIPLQCRIVAECFLQHAKRKLEQNKDAVASVEEDGKLDETIYFDLARLYERLMEATNFVFVQDKSKLSRLLMRRGSEPMAEENVVDNILKQCLEETLKNIKCHLLKLAMETIFLEREDIEILCPPPSFVYPSDKKRDQERNGLDVLSVSFGLTNINGQGKVKFLHRTYAEYLVADYLYRRFLLDENRHNNLLEDKFILNFILDGIFVKDEYDGVVTFLDSMLKKLVENQDW